MSFDNFMAITGGGDYNGMEQYPDANDYDGKWGIYDEPYLKYFAGELKVKATPFFSTVFTLSAHHPYKIPAAYEKVFNEGSLPIHKCIRYSDYALSQFFRQARHMPWFSNTIFMITADHAAENEKPYYQTPAGRYEIPLLVFGAGINVEHREETMQQLDLLPLILQSASYRGKFFSFSNEGLSANYKDARFAIQYFDNYYQLIHWPYVYQSSGDKVVGFYELRSDRLMKNNIAGKMPLVQMKLDTVLRSVLQVYHDRLVGNKTLVDGPIVIP
jgi:phosphoglycerol transferase MdoB-like AlkP superfamily enzyme